MKLKRTHAAHFLPCRIWTEVSPNSGLNVCRSSTKLHSSSTNTIVLVLQLRIFLIYNVSAYMVVTFSLILNFCLFCFLNCSAITNQWLFLTCRLCVEVTTLIWKCNHLQVLYSKPYPRKVPRFHLPSPSPHSLLWR